MLHAAVAHTAMPHAAVAHIAVSHAVIAHIAVPHAAVPHPAAPPERPGTGRGQTEKGPAWAQAWSQGDLSCKQQGESPSGKQLVPPRVLLLLWQPRDRGHPSLALIISCFPLLFALCCKLVFDVGPFFTSKMSLLFKRKTHASEYPFPQYITFPP